MKCKDCLLRLEEYIGQELNEEDTTALTAHLTTCAVCSNYYEILKHEQVIYSKYSPDVKATPALWSNINAQVEIINRNNFPYFSRLSNLITDIFSTLFRSPAYLTILLVFLITAGVLVRVIKYNSAEEITKTDSISQNNVSNIAQSLPEKYGLIPENDKLISDKTKPLASQPENKIKISKNKIYAPRNILRTATLKLQTKRFVNSELATQSGRLSDDEVVENAARQYILAIKILSHDIKNKRKQLSSDKISSLEESLFLLDRTINETRRIVKAQPRDPVAVQYMRAAYDKKVELLMMIAEN